MSRQDHWNTIYETKADTEVSWYEPKPALSLELIQSVRPSGGNVIDVGGGASRLVDALSALDVSEIAVLDVSPVSLQKAKERLDPRGERVRWIVGDVTALSDLGRFDVWHDRAVFHFLTDPGERRRYASLAARTVPPGGHAIIGTFALNGPHQCSGLEVCRYDATGLARELGPAFQLIGERMYRHVTPAGKVQPFCFAILQRTQIPPSADD